MDVIYPQCCSLDVHKKTVAACLITSTAGLDSIPGVGQRAAEILMAEIGTDMSRFPSVKHLASWAGMCPGNHESGGKRLSGKTRKGSRWLRQVHVEIAHVASKTKNTYLAAQYKRIAARRGKKRALIAVGHTILSAIWELPPNLGEP